MARAARLLLAAALCASPAAALVETLHEEIDGTPQWRARAAPSRAAAGVKFRARRSNVLVQPRPSLPAHLVHVSTPARLILRTGNTFGSVAEFGFVAARSRRSLCVGCNTLAWVGWWRGDTCALRSCVGVLHSWIIFFAVVVRTVAPRGPPVAGALVWRHACRCCVRPSCNRRVDVARVAALYRRRPIGRDGVHGFTARCGGRARLPTSLVV